LRCKGWFSGPPALGLCLSGIQLAYLFPWDADYIRTWGADAGNSRIWAGIHYQFDNVAGNQLGKNIADKCIAWASQDGSQ
jgi:hypothetical protein